jgi:hypothetical protein
MQCASLRAIKAWLVVARHEGRDMATSDTVPLGAHLINKLRKTYELPQAS